MRNVSCAARRSAASGGVEAADFFAVVFLALPVFERLGLALLFLAAAAGFFCFARGSADLDRVFGPC